MPAAARKITETDILSDRDYAARRGIARRSHRLEKHRRVEVGPFATFYFENYQTMWLQVQEMLRIEKGGAEQLAGELEAYNPRSAGRRVDRHPDAGNRGRNTPQRRSPDAGRNRRDDLHGDRKHPDRGHADRNVDRTTADGKTSSVHGCASS